MRKLLRKVACVLIIFSVSITLFIGCGNQGDNQDGGGQVIDPNKEQIILSVFNGGFGYQWAVELANAWNEQNDEYQIIVSPNKDEYYIIQANLEAGTCKYDIMLNTPYAEEYAKGYLEDLSEIYNAKPAGETRTVYEKLTNKRMADDNFKYQGDYFGIPFFESVCGFVYDHEVFKEKRFLIGEDGNLIASPNSTLSVGRDGIPGTVDDGQPVNLEQYQKMISAIKDSGFYTYLWTGKFTYYTEPLFWTLFLDYAGKDNYFNIFKTQIGEYYNPKTQQTINITPATGYDVLKMAGVYESLKFIDDYLADPTLYHPASAKFSTSHTDAQKIFVYGNAFEGSTPDGQTAFLYEGSWWENEAKANFNSLYNRGMTEYQYGTRDYRIMLPPSLDSYAQTEEIPLVTFDSISLFVKKQSDADKLAAIKDFVAYLFKDESVKKIVKQSGGMMPFDVELTEEDFAEMTRFTRNVYELYTREDTYMVSTKYDISIKNSLLYFRIGTNSTANPVDFFLRGPGVTTIGNAQQAYDDTYNYYKNNWNNL